MNEPYGNKTGLVQGESQKSDLQSFIGSYNNQVFDVHNINKRLYDILSRLRGVMPIVQKDESSEIKAICLLNEFEDVRVKLNYEINTIYNQLDELEKII